MGLSDPFQTTYEGSRQGLGTFGQALQMIAQQYAEKKKEERKQQKEWQQTLELLGIKTVLEKEVEKLKTEEGYKQDFFKSILKGEIRPAQDRQVATAMGKPVMESQTQQGIPGAVSFAGTPWEAVAGGKQYQTGLKRSNIGSSVKVIGNSLVKYDQETGTAQPIYTSPANKQLFKDSSGAVREYDKTTGEQRVLIDAMGEPVEKNTLEQSTEEVTPISMKQESALPKGVTEEDIQFTMKKRNLTREQVLQKIKK